MKDKLFALTVLIIFFSFIDGHAQNVVSKGTLGLLVGNWKPYHLDTHPANPLKTVQGAKPFIGLTGTTPSFNGYSLSFTVFQWHQKGLEHINKESVFLRHFSVGLKNAVLPNSPVTPYVSVGLAAIWSREVPVKSKGEKIPLDRAGIGFDVGAGLDFLIKNKYGLVIEYQYVYAKFAKTVGLTDNYSGPQISLKLLYLF